MSSTDENLRASCKQKKKKKNTDCFEVKTRLPMFNLKTKTLDAGRHGHSRFPISGVIIASFTYVAIIPAEPVKCDNEARRGEARRDGKRAKEKGAQSFFSAFLTFVDEPKRVRPFLRVDLEFLLEKLPYVFSRFVGLCLCLVAVLLQRNSWLVSILIALVLVLAVARSVRHCSQFSSPCEENAGK